MADSNLIPIPASPKRSKRLDDGAESDYYCLCCAKPLKAAALARAWYVQMTTSNLLAPVATDHPKSQGFFPVGSECAKLVPLAYRRKFISAKAGT